MSGKVWNLNLKSVGTDLNQRLKININTIVNYLKIFSNSFVICLFLSDHWKSFSFHQRPRERRQVLPGNTQVSGSGYGKHDFY